MAESYLGSPGNHTGKTFDKALELYATGATLTSATASPVINIGTGLVNADLVLNIHTITGTGNSIKLQFSDSAAFGTVKDGISVVLDGATAGTMIVPFRNIVQPDGMPCAYMRIMPDGTGIKLGAFVAKK